MQGGLSGFPDGLLPRLSFDCALLGGDFATSSPVLLCERFGDALLLSDLAPFLDSLCLKKQSSPLGQVPFEIHCRQSPWVAGSFAFGMFLGDALGEDNPFFGSASFEVLPMSLSCSLV